MDSPLTPIRRTRRQVSPRALPALLSIVTLLVLPCVLLLALAAAPAAALSFAPAKYYATGNGPAALDTGDFNGDGRPDVVTANTLGGNVRVLRRTTRGGFVTSRPFATGDGPWSLAVADLDHNDVPDVVTANGGDGTVSVLLGDGTGGLGAKSDFIFGQALGPYNTAVAVGEFNGDTHPDVVVSNGAEAAVLLGNGAGGLAAPYRVPTLEDSKDIAVGYFNADGNVDFVAVGGVFDYPEGAGVLLGDGTGQFSPPAFQGTYLEPKLVSVGDMDGDGRQDLVISETLEGTGVLEVLLGNGAGGVAVAPGGRAIVTQEGGLPLGVALGDLNGDGREDVASALGTRALVLRGDGQGGLSKPLAFPAGAHPSDIAVADFNRDGLLDLATADSLEDSVSVLLNGPRAASVLRSLSPVRGRIGAVVTVTGIRFGLKRGAGVVRFGAARATDYVSWNSTKVKVRVPQGTARGWVKVTVKTVAGSSAPEWFRLL